MQLEPRVSRSEAAVEESLEEDSWFRAELDCGQDNLSSTKN